MRQPEREKQKKQSQPANRQAATSPDQFLGYSSRCYSTHSFISKKTVVALSKVSSDKRARSKRAALVHPNTALTESIYESGSGHSLTALGEHHDKKKIIKKESCLICQPWPRAMKRTVRIVFYNRLINMPLNAKKTAFS